MKKRIAAAGLLCLACLLAPGPARAMRAESASKYNFIVLTPGHSQTMYFELDDTVVNNRSEYHTFYCITVGPGILNLRVGPASSVGQFATMMYAVAGLYNLTPLAKYGYNAETISVSATAPAFGAAVVFTAITGSTGSPDYPIVMGLVATLIE